jgi:hypothetical protein
LLLPIDDLKESDCMVDLVELLQEHNFQATKASGLIPGSLNTKLADEQRIVAYAVHKYLNEHAALSTLQIIAALKQVKNEAWIKTITTKSYSINDAFELSQFSENGNARCSTPAARYVVGQGNPYLFETLNHFSIQHLFLGRALEQIVQPGQKIMYVDNSFVRLNKGAQRTILYYKDPLAVQDYLKTHLSTSSKHAGVIFTVQY